MFGQRETRVRHNVARKPSALIDSVPGHRPQPPTSLNPTSLVRLYLDTMTTFFAQMNALSSRFFREKQKRAKQLADFRHRVQLEIKERRDKEAKRLATEEKKLSDDKIARRAVILNFWGKAKVKVFFFPRILEYFRGCSRVGSNLTGQVGS